MSPVSLQLLLVGSFACERSFGHLLIAPQSDVTDVTLVQMSAIWQNDYYPVCMSKSSKCIGRTASVKKEKSVLNQGI